jgi:hypothetical protein
VYAQVMATGVGGETPGELEAGGYQSFEEGRIKHMEAIQGVVARLSDNSSKVKGLYATKRGERSRSLAVR